MNDASIILPDDDTVCAMDWFAMTIPQAAARYGLGQRNLRQAIAWDVGPPTFRRGRLLMVCPWEMSCWAWENSELVWTPDGEPSVRWLPLKRMRPLRERPCRHGEIEP